MQMLRRARKSEMSLIWRHVCGLEPAKGPKDTAI